VTVLAHFDGELPVLTVASYWSDLTSKIDNSGKFYISYSNAGSIIPMNQFGVVFSTSTDKTGGGGNV
jgi:exonuclease V gamma subunit